MSERRAKRGYDSSRRQAQARETRQRILDAARRLFVARGYTGTTMETLARDAGVAVETVYAAFGSKQAVLTQLIHRAVGGDDDPIPILARPGPQSVHAEKDQRRQVRGFAQGMSEIMARVGPLFGVMRSAATTEPEIAELLRNLLAARHDNLAAVVRWLESNGPLRPGLSREDATDTLWAVSSAETHQLLTVDRGWTPAHYAQWLGDTLIALLLPPEDATQG